jgi:2,3-bisphosphoglycerate-independent phosphoglycerate mutase
MILLFLFLDGVGLGSTDPTINPFANQEMPNMQQLLGGHSLLYGTHLPLTSERATLLPLDACLGVPGLPQSATGQATLLTGENVASRLGYHYGPKPNPPIRDLLKNGTLLSRLKDMGLNCSMLNAYPPRYFDSIESGRRIYSVFPLAVTNAGILLKNFDDLKSRNALSADFTAQGWREQLNIIDAPQLNEFEAGTLLGKLSKKYDFAIFEYWLSDYAGHKQKMSQANELLASFDKVFGSLLKYWQDEEGLILLTSDHGNLEDMRTRRHTKNHVPALLVGNSKLRQKFINLMYAVNDSHGQLDLTCLAPAIYAFLTEEENPS